LSVALYLDENVHRAIAVGLRLRGVDILTVQDDGRSGIDDPAVLDRATELGRPLFSQDEDLLVEGHRRQAAGESFAGIIFAHQLHVTLGDCVRDLHLIATLADPEELANRVEFLPL
jgi:hypothetical protein